MDVPIAMEQLIAALRRHAWLMSEPAPEGEAGIDAFDALRSAAVAYGRTVREATGWDSPFDELEEFEEFGGAADQEQDSTRPDRPGDSGRATETHPDTRFVVSGSWEFEVTDPRLWSDFVARQPGAAELLDGGTHIPAAEAAAALLAGDALSRLLAPHGAVLTHEEWGVSDTLDEDPDEDSDEDPDTCMDEPGKR
ncbi:hypothetical protein [Streptomyces sp. NPDC004435]|uniref:hypothetical protein n=1 Tax=Streptomyces sp. NPDC004435 TaxID=3364701 RepID=UPI0036B5A68E